VTDLTNIDVSGAKLPSTYHAAKRAISQCASIDECKDWADKAAALASYAKQAQDDQLEQMAKRIRARATRRAGELLKQIDGRVGQNLPGHKETDADAFSRASAAREVGLSRRQMYTATSMANVPDDTFEEMVESGATVTEIAAAGTQRRETPADRAAAKALVRAVDAYRSALAEIDLDAALEALDEPQRIQLRMAIGRLDSIHDKVVTSL